MKLKIKMLAIMFAANSIVSVSMAQDVFLYPIIGKSISTVISKYGQPKHKDESNPSMVCLFYKNGANNMVIVSDETEIFQAESNKLYSSEKDAKNDFDEMISKSIQDGMISDTVDASNVNLHKNGVMFTLNLLIDNGKSKFEIKSKATRHSE